MAGQRKISVAAWLPAVAVVVPAALLALLGWRAYQAESLLLRDRFVADQAAIVRLVGGRLSEEAHKALTDLLQQFREHLVTDALEARFVATHPLARHIFVARGGRLLYPAAPVAVSDDRGRARSGELLFEADVRKYIRRLRLRRRLRTVVMRGLSAEYTGSLREAARYYLRVSLSNEPLAAQALLGLARVYRHLGRRSDAVEAYGQLRRRFGTLQDEQGVSFALLADAGQAELGKTSRLLEMHRQLQHSAYKTSAESRRYYLGWVIDNLSRAVKGDREPRGKQVTLETLARMRRRTEALYASDRFGELLRRYGITERYFPAGVMALSIGPQTTLAIMREGEAIVGYALDEAVLQRRVSAEQRKLESSGRGIRLALVRPGTSRERAGVGRVLHREVLEPPLGFWTLVASPSAGDPLADMEREGQMRHFGMVVGLLIVLAAGLLFTYRGVRRESELARLKSDFASNVSHELKTPLTSIRMYAEMLQQDIANTPQDQRRYQGVIVRESERLGRLIANVLDFSRIERGTRRYDLRPELLNSMADDAVKTFERLFADEEVVVRADLPSAERLWVIADREAALQSILNLLNNAAKYSRGTAEIEVRLIRGDDENGIAVTDYGIGIPAGEQKRIFDDFYRSPQARSEGVEGTGLGLALVRRHMAAYGGRVELRSTVGEGSTFTLWFQAAEKEES